MPDRSSVPPRPWQEIAAELAKEQNPERVTELAAELAAAMDEQTGAGKVKSVEKKGTS